MNYSKSHTYIGITCVIILVMSFVIQKEDMHIGNTIGNKDNIDISKIAVGMSSTDFREIFPDILPADDSYSGTGFEVMEYGNIKGGWKYRFEKNILKSANFEWYQILQYDDLNEGKSNNATQLFKSCYPSAQSIVNKLTKLYGEPNTKIISDTTGWIANYDTYSTDLISASWENNGAKINFKFQFDGREKPNPYENKINSPGISHAFRIQIEITGKEEKKLLHFQLGETAQEMEKRNPAIFKNGTGLFGNFRKKEKIGSLNGEWSFCFKNGKLQNAGFDLFYHEKSYDNDELTEKKYESLIADFRSAKEQLILTFGKPSAKEETIPDFKTIEEHKVRSSDLMFYEWKNAESKVQLSLRYHYGGKGEFHSSFYFDVKITDKTGNYSYCDQ